MRTTAILILLLAPATAFAQVAFPADSAFLPMRCGNAVMTDAFADTSFALNERDIVGDGSHPAGLRASDSTNLYMRIRLEEDPAPGGVPRQYSWGMEFDFDTSRSTYEILVLVDGQAAGGGTVTLFNNTTTSLPNDPNDPADQAVASYPFSMNARSRTAPGTSYGGSADYWIDFAVPWSALRPLGFDGNTPTYVVVGTGTSSNSLNGDFACHDGGSGTATFDGTASGQTTADPTQDPNTPPIGGSGHLEGGSGCAATHGSAWWFALALLVPLRRRRPR